MYFLFFLILLIPNQTFAETIYTPYQEIKAPTFQEDLEKKEVKKLYLLEENPILTKKYYKKEKQIKGYIPLENEFIKTPYSSFKKKCITKNDLEIEWITKTWYQVLTPITKVKIESSKDILLYEIKIKEKKKIIFQKEKVYLKESKEFVTNLLKPKNIEDLTIELTFFLKQDQKEIQITIQDNASITFQTYLIKKKGFSKIESALTKEIQHFTYQNEIKTTTKDPPFYSRILKQERYCRTRKKRYRFQKIPKQILSEAKEKEGYHLIKEIEKTIYYRREKIVLKDNLLSKTPYLLIDDFVIETSFPLKELKLSYDPLLKEGTYPILFSYQNFQVKRYFTYQKNVE